MIQKFPVERNHLKVLLSLHKSIYKSVLPSGDTTPLQKNPKKYPINRIIPKLIKLLKILNQIFKKLKHAKRRIKNLIILIRNRMSQVQVTMKIIMIKTKT